jgi:hypothetical protein
MQPDVQHGGAAAAAVQVRRQRRHEPAEHEGQRFQPLDRPFEIERLLESLLGHRRQQRPRIAAARQALPPHTALSEPRGHRIGRQRGDVAEGAKAPAAECFEKAVRIVRIVRVVRIVRSSFGSFSFATCAKQRKGNRASATTSVPGSMTVTGSLAA